jgi:formamidopyrimidine-DNA glycosylase
MPELPEVETVVRGLQPVLTGRSIDDTECRQLKALNMPLDAFRQAARGSIVRVWRRAKSAILDLPGGTLWLHLGLGGRVVHTTEPVAGATFAFRLDNGDWLAMRHAFMGHAHFVLPADLEKELAAFGPEPIGLSPEQIGGILSKGKSLTLKALLMDQARIAGIGNVYSDEILHRMKIYPGLRAGALPSPEVARLAATITEVLEEALAGHGEPGFTGVHGEPGIYWMRIHRQEKCGVCGALAEKLSLAGRTAYRCPVCQPEVRS